MGYNILIVDDSQTMRKVIRKAVVISGFDLGDCWEAENGHEALKLIDEKKIDLVLTDLNMPKIGGLELIREMKRSETHREIPVVLITTQGSQTRLKEATLLGASCCVRKPFHPEEIRDTLNRIMEKTRV